MPARRLPMRKIREVLRLRHEQGLSHQAVARVCAIGVGTVNRYLRRAVEAGLGWPLPVELDDAALEARLFPRAAPVHDRVRPDRAYIHRELNATASRCGSSGRSTPRSTRTAIVAPSSAIPPGYRRDTAGPPATAAGARLSRSSPRPEAGLWVGDSSSCGWARKWLG